MEESSRTGHFLQTMISSQFFSSSPQVDPPGVSTSESTDDEYEHEMPRYELPPRNNIARQYNRKNDDDSMASSPVFSEVLHADDDDDDENDTPRFHHTDDGSKGGQSDKKGTDNQGDEDDEDEWGIIDDPVFEQRIYDSPRLFTDDNEIFPSRFSRALLCMNDNQRWEEVSAQAGSHRQDGSTFTIRRTMTPTAVKYGMLPRYAASRVRTIFLWLDLQQDILPQWLDVLATLFTKLEHLTILQDAFEGEEEIEVSARMRRLYILYRLPDLKSIDGATVTRRERALARPSSPNGERVTAKDWTGKESKSSLLDDEEEEDEEEDESNVGMKDVELEISENDLSDHPKETAIRQHVPENSGISVAGNDHHDDIESTDDDDSLDGEQVADLINAVSLSLSGEEREDLCSISRDECDYPGIRPAPGYSHHSTRTALHEINKADDSQNLPTPSTRQTTHDWKSIPAPSKTSTIRELRNGQKVNKRHSSSQSQLDLLSQANTMDTLELISVVSSHHEWSATCGVLSFHRSDRSCAPRVQLNFCGRGDRKRIADNKKQENNDRNLSRFKIDKPVQAVVGTSGSTLEKASRTASWQKPSRDNNNDRGNVSLIPNDQDQSSSPAEGLTPKMQGQADASSRGQNLKLPPSQSLSSPFPMQFRDRALSLRISTAEMELNKPIQSVVPSSPRARSSMSMDTITQPIALPFIGPSSPPRKKSVSAVRQAMATSRKHGLPPPCPGTVRRKVVAASLLQRGLDSDERKQSRQARRAERRKRAFQETARSTSVMDDLDDETEDDSSSDGEALECDFCSTHEGSVW